MHILTVAKLERELSSIEALRELKQELRTQKEVYSVAYCSCITCIS